FIADTSNNVVRKVDYTTGAITTVAGDGAYGSRGDGGAATAAELSLPMGVAVDMAGNLFIADHGNRVIRQVDRVTGVITTVAGNGTSGYTGDGGPATAAELKDAAGIAVDTSGDLFLVDTGNDAIREVSMSAALVATVAKAQLTIT